MRCMVPDTGITISPIGDIVLCCAADNVSLGHIKDVDNLTDFFNSDVYQQLRKEFSKGKFREQCSTCINHAAAGRIARFQAYNRFNFPTYEDDLTSNIIPIRFLEITTSNICNQMCVTCSGKYSSKWAPYEQEALDAGLTWRKQNHKFFTEIYKMSSKDVDKVLDLVPHLQHLTIKGGEPFADPNNIKILRKIADTNPNCRVEICTNFQLVTNTVIEILHKINEVHIQASIDAVGPLYNWIRGGDFKKTVNNINRYHAVSGRKVVIVSTVSIYNWMDLDKLIDYWHDVPGVDRISMANMVTFPRYCSPLHIYEHHIKQGLDKFWAYLDSKFTDCGDGYNYTSDTLVVSGLNNINSVKLTNDEWDTNEDVRPRIVEWINWCLVVRQNDEDIFELVPYLKDYKT
jgi:MoaA/NifB/PqqE/SkfB family radical SAM enzyme